IGHLVTGRANQLQLSGKLRGPLANDKKGRPGFKAAQDLEHARRMDGVRPVVDGQPNFTPPCFKMRQHRPPPLTVCDQGGKENEQMRKEEKTERDPGMKSNQGEEKKRRRE